MAVQGSGLGPMVSAAQIAASVDGLRFDTSIMGFEFRPSLGIVAKDIDRFGADIRSMREPLTKSIREVMIPSFRTNFASGGRPAWEHLSPTTVRKRKGQSGPILIRSGSLLRTMSTLRIWSITQTSATIKDLPEKAWYGKVHQEGNAGGQFSAGNWFKKYESAAKKMLGPDAHPDEVKETAFKIFDKRLSAHGLAPSDPTVPARPFAVFQDEDLDAIQYIFAEWLEDRLRKVGRFK